MALKRASPLNWEKLFLASDEATVDVKMLPIDPGPVRPHEERDIAGRVFGCPDTSMREQRYELLTEPVINPTRIGRARVERVHGDPVLPSPLASAGVMAINMPFVAI